MTTVAAGADNTANQRLNTRHTCGKLNVMTQLICVGPAKFESSNIFQNWTISADNSNDSAQTIGTADMKPNNTYRRSGLSAGRADTTPSAASLAALFTAPRVGDSFLWCVINTAAQNLTITAGSNVTIVGNAVVNNAGATFRVVITAINPPSANTTISVVRC